ncbi:MAG: YbhB/YbcL family Raf kinase inhibitor-like protein [Armatimonadota bacterium]|jgi:Raf kinase inhibitor-like YbhB/YbcL family protein
MNRHVMLVISAAVMLTLIAWAGCQYQSETGQVPEESPEIIEEMRSEETAVDEEEGPMAWIITSSAFEDGETIPEKYTDDGEDVSPPLTFEGVPEGTVEIALICHDPDAPRAGGWTHWVAYGMAPDIGGLPEDVPAEETVEDPGLVQGENSWGNIGYGGPAPPPGDPHRYQFRGYALSGALELEPGATQDELEAAMEGRVIGEAMLEGLYGRD